MLKYNQKGNNNLTTKKCNQLNTPMLCMVSLIYIENQISQISLLIRSTNLCTSKTRIFLLKHMKIDAVFITVFKIENFAFYMNILIYLPYICSTPTGLS